MASDLYGFVITLEVGLFLVASLFIALKLDMVLEGIFFFVIFSPLRSYAGGLHLEKFWICFVLSCLTYITTLLVVKNLCLHEFVSLIVLFALEVFVYVLYPVENRNREINEEENKCFKIKLMKYLCLDFFIGIVCTIFEKDSYFLELNIIFLIVKLYKYLQIDSFTQELEVKSFRLKAIIPRKPSTFRG